MIHELKAQGRKYQMLPNFGICCMELDGLKVKRFRTCVRSFSGIPIQHFNGSSTGNLQQFIHQRNEENN